MKRASGWIRIYALGVRVLCVACVVLLAAQAVRAQSAYRHLTPPGWQLSVADGIEAFTPTQEPPDTVQMMLLPPKPLQGDFAAQFNAERQSLEAQWGLTAPQAAAPQSGRVGATSYAAHYASYDSSGGARYMAFMAAGQNGRFAMLVFVAASPDAFNRLAPQAAALLQSLQIGR
jgi:hypothetical protein